MMDGNTICVVKNRSSSKVCYLIPEDGIRREFAPNESKKIKYSELEKLSFQPGGVALMTQFLQIQAPAAIEELNIHAEPEYNMNEQDIVNLIKTGSLDSFLDCLDFAPTGVIDLIKKYAVSLPMENREKMKALKEKTGFDVGKALQNIEAEKAEENEGESQASAATSGRRVVIPDNTTSGEGARRTTPKYNVVTPKK